MLQIGKRQDSTWHNLDSFTGEMPPEGVACVAFKMRQATGLDESIAETNARANIARMAEGAVDAVDYGLDAVEWAQAIVDGAAPLLAGVGYQVYTVELAMLCASEMRGVEDENGEPAEWTKRNVALVLQSRRPSAEAFQGLQRLGTTYADTFASLALKTVRGARAEGKP